MNSRPTLMEAPARAEDCFPGLISHMLTVPPKEEPKAEPEAEVMKSKAVLRKAKASDPLPKDSLPEGPRKVIKRRKII